MTKNKTNQKIPKDNTINDGIEKTKQLFEFEEERDDEEIIPKKIFIESKKINKYKVIFVKESSLIVDDNGKGFKIQKSEKYKNVKEGDEIEIAEEN